MPPGIRRQVLLGNTSLLQQNEQSLSMRTCGLRDGDGRAVFKNTSVDMRMNKRMKMFVHAEAADDPNLLKDEDVRLFVRISGSLDDPKVGWDKKGKKEAAQQQFERSQQESKEMLKTTFGFYQNDPSVGTYQEKTSPHETIQVKFKTKDDAAKTQAVPQATAPKNGKLQQKLEKWKQEQEQTGVAVKIKG
jgi:hypothetical protein